MKKTLALLAMLCLLSNVNAQQDPQFSQYMHNKVFMNPASAGMKHALCFTGIARQQWAGFDGAPKSGVFSADVYNEDLSSGFGLTFMFDQLGFEKNLGYKFAYSLHREKIANGTLGLGVELGAATKILGPTGSDSWIASSNWQNDPSVPPNIKKTNFDVGLGLWYQNKNLWCGISSSHIMGGEFNQGVAVTNGPPITIHKLVYSITRHYWITGGYNWYTPNVTIKPSFIFKSDLTVTSVDINCIAALPNGFWFGSSWRIKDAICPMIGFEWLAENKQFQKDVDNNPGLEPEFHEKIRPSYNKYSTCKIGFSYDVTTSKLSSYSNGSFEIFVNYCIPYVPRTARHGDVRIFK